MIGYLIDPLERRVREFKHDGDIDQIYRLIDAEFFDTCAINEAGDAVYVGEFSQDNEHASKFKIEGHPERLVGKAVILGVDEDGMTCSPSMSLEEVRAKITYSPSLQALRRRSQEMSGP